MGDQRKRLRFNKGVDEFRDLSYDIDYDLVVAAAYTAHAPFPPPPADVIPSKDELIDGLMHSFEVPDMQGELPV